MAGQTIVDITLGVLLADFIMYLLRAVLHRIARYRAGRLRVTLGDLRNL